MAKPARNKSKIARRTKPKAKRIIAKRLGSARRKTIANRSGRISTFRKTRTRRRAA